MGIGAGVMGSVCGTCICAMKREWGGYGGSMVCGVWVGAWVVWVGVVRVSGGEVSEKVSVDWCGGDEECVRQPARVCAFEREWGV